MSKNRCFKNENRTDIVIQQPKKKVGLLVSKNMKITPNRLRVPDETLLLITTLSQPVTAIYINKLIFFIKPLEKKCFQYVANEQNEIDNFHETGNSSYSKHKSYF